MRDLDDTMRLIAANRLAPEFGDQLDPSVRAKFRELWELAQVEEDY